MKKICALLVGIILALVPINTAQATPNDVCTPDIVVGGIITVHGTCIGTPILPSPLPTLPPIKVPPIKIPPVVPPTIGHPSPSPKPTPTKSRGPVGSGGTVKPFTPTPKHKAKVSSKTPTVKKQRVVVIHPNGRTEQQKEEARRTLIFWFFASMAIAGLAYLVFYRKKDPDGLDSNPPVR